MLTFTAPFDSGGSVVTGFVITISPGGATVACQASPCLITGLASGVAYTFSVRATNAVGGGIESPTARAPAHSPSFRIQVDYRVPAVCAPRCTAHAELRTRSGRRLYTVPLPGDGQVVLGTRTSLRLTGGTHARFSITIDRAKLLRAPFATVGGKRVATTRLRVWLTTASGTQLTVHDGRIAVSVARIESAGVPLLALTSATRELGRILALEPWVRQPRRRSGGSTGTRRSDPTWP
jgi:hypothetical protein